MLMAGASEIVYSMIMTKNDHCFNINFQNPDEDSSKLDIEKVHGKYKWLFVEFIRLRGNELFLIVRKWRP
jgi:hypothetical protein